MYSEKHPKSQRTTKSKPVVLVILDGWGLAPPNPGNAVTLAKTPVMTNLWKNYPHTQLAASGLAVGLPQSQVGNSEAGHVNLGAGRTVEQDSVRISKAIQQGLFFKNPAFLKAVSHVKKNHSALHLMGMLSDGGSAHADPDHLLALILLARIHQLKKVYLHLFTDGRDSPRHSGLKLISDLSQILKTEKVATIMGRFYAMDRKKDWSRTKIAYETLVLGIGREAKDPKTAITEAYNRDETDEFIPPYVLKNNRQPIATIKDRDAIIFFNLRSDRARQLAKPFVQPDFEKMNPGSFQRKKILEDVIFTAMTDFGPDLGNIATAYPSEDLFDTLPMILADFSQLYIAEAEKYAHITFFFNGGYPDPVGGEIRIRIPSPDVKSYDLTPKMSAGEITSQVLKKTDSFDFIGVNFANADMIGHTGNLQAGILAVEFLDQCLGKIKEAVLKQGGILIITADHGNIEEMIDLKTGEILTQHSKNPVPFILVSKDGKQYKLKDKGGILGDVAPTMLELIGMSKPKLMTGKSLLV